MPPKSRPPAPIDRPLSKAYLRGFEGWSTAYPPGLSEPNSIRTMENVMVTREGAARVRPGLRSYLRTKTDLPLVGSHELFYLPTGKAYLVAVRETVDVGTEDEREIVSFRVIGDRDDDGTIVMDTLDAFGFDVPTDPHVLSFTAATTYVKYLQIDNKIFALSNAPEGMLMFWVGDEKKAKKLQSIVRPEWDPDDKLTAMHPDGAWVDSNIPTSTRKNYITNPDFETNRLKWSTNNAGTQLFWSEGSSVGTHALGALPLPERTNWARSPLHDPAGTGLDGWSAVRATLSVVGSDMQVRLDKTDSYGYAISDQWEVPSGKTMQMSFDLTSISNAKNWRTWVQYFRSNGEFLSLDSGSGSNDFTAGRKTSKLYTVPTQAKYARLLIGGEPTSPSVNMVMRINDVSFALEEESASKLDGDMGADYYWEGTPNDSRSLYQPARDIWMNSDDVPVVPGDWTLSADLRGATGRTVELSARGYDANGSIVLATTDTMVGTNAYSRMDTTITVPAGVTRVAARAILRDAERGEAVRIDAVLLEKASSAGTYFSGATPNAGSLKRRWLGAPHASASVEEDFTPTLPTPETPTSSTLVSSDSARNRHSFSFFYTISNELGESAASQVTTIKAQRQWTAWEWLTPSSTDTDDPELCADQLVVLMPEEVFNVAVASGATHWTAYYWYQGPNDAPSVTAQRFAEIDLTNEPTHLQHGYARLTPQMVKIGLGDPLVPSESTRFNASDPVKGSQGIVAADRLILVGNPADPAKISWSSGAPGDYHNFSQLLGGGTKQLTSGNLYLTACVKLWQNPQSVDTITVMNLGDDGRSNAYYMQPAQITSLSESISVMGFEEVTALMGTISPYGVEVVSNGLYHPLFHGLFKSTANNYNISSKSVSDTIQNMWRTLQAPHRIVSAQLDSRIYYLVHNIQGAPLEPNCRGNEIWVLDLMGKTPTWSRWLVQGASLRAMDIDDVVMMSVIRPDGIFTFNEDRYTDERFNPDTELLEVVNIPWYLETNTQGANRAHDAWCHLQQSNIMVGNFLGQMRYGVRGHDVHGREILLEKVVLSSNPPPDGLDDEDLTIGVRVPTLATTEREDYLLVQKTMKEWTFFAGSVNDEDDDGELVPRFSGGQVGAVQYRYTPATVNVGYEYGSVETFEYGQIYDRDATTDSGTPQPYTDLSRA